MSFKNNLTKPIPATWSTEFFPCNSASVFSKTWPATPVRSKNQNREHFSRNATQCFWSITAESRSLQSCQFKGSIKLLTANTVWNSITTSTIKLIPPWVIISARLSSSRWVELLEFVFSFLSLVQLVHFNEDWNENQLEKNNNNLLSWTLTLTLVHVQTHSEHWVTTSQHLHSDIRELSAAMVLPSSNQPVWDRQILHVGVSDPAYSSLNDDKSDKKFSCSSVLHPAGPRSRAPGCLRCPLHLQKKRGTKAYFL